MVGSSDCGEPCSQGADPGRSWLLLIAFNLIEPWRFMLRGLRNSQPIDLRWALLAAMTFLPAWGFWRLWKGPSLLAILPSLALTILATWGLTETVLTQGGLLKALDSLEDLLLLGGLLASYVSLVLFFIAARKLKAFIPEQPWKRL